MLDEIIKLDNPLAMRFGFTSDLFDGWLWVKGDTVYISFIISLEAGKGHFRGLVNRILRAGFKVAVPTPIADMEYIVKKWGFTRTFEHFDSKEPCEVWVSQSFLRASTAPLILRGLH